MVATVMKEESSQFPREPQMEPSPSSGKLRHSAAMKRSSSSVRQIADLGELRRVLGQDLPAAAAKASGCGSDADWVDRCMSPPPHGKARSVWDVVRTFDSQCSKMLAGFGHSVVHGSLSAPVTRKDDVSRSPSMGDWIADKSMLDAKSGKWKSAPIPSIWKSKTSLRRSLGLFSSSQETSNMKKSASCPFLGSQVGQPSKVCSPTLSAPVAPFEPPVRSPPLSPPLLPADTPPLMTPEVPTPPISVQIPGGLPPVLASCEKDRQITPGSEECRTQPNSAGHTPAACRGDEALWKELLDFTRARHQNAETSVKRLPSLAFNSNGRPRPSQIRTDFSSDIDLSPKRGGNPFRDNRQAVDAASKPAKGLSGVASAPQLPTLHLSPLLQQGHRTSKCRDAAYALLQVNHVYHFHAAEERSSSLPAAAGASASDASVSPDRRRKGPQSFKISQTRQEQGSDLSDSYEAMLKKFPTEHMSRNRLQVPDARERGRPSSDKFDSYEMMLNKFPTAPVLNSKVIHGNTRAELEAEDDLPFFYHHVRRQHRVDPFATRKP